MQDLNKNTQLSRGKEILFNTIDDEIIMMSSENGEYYGLDAIGSWIWEKIEKPLSFGKLIEMIINDFEVTEDQCIEDVTAFLQSMNEKHLIIFSENA